MKVKRLAVLGFAALAAGGAFVLANKLGNKEPVVREVVRDEGPKIEFAEVLVASEDISMGTNLKPGMVKWQKWPKEGLAAGYLTKEDAPDGIDTEKPAIARSAFYAGEPIRESKLVRAGNGYMSAILPTGQRAIATSISTATSAGGFILPNDRVDVIMTRRKENSQNSGSATSGFITEMILENVRVLAIDQTIEEKDGEAVVVGETATLQLSPEQAKILTVAQQMADRLALSLRSLEDSGDEETKGAAHLLNGNLGNGRVKLIKYGNSQEIVTGSGDAN